VQAIVGSVESESLTTYEATPPPTCWIATTGTVVSIDHEYVADSPSWLPAVPRTVNVCGPSARATLGDHVPLAHGTPVPSRAQTNPVAFAAENPKPAVASGETLAGVEIHAIAPTATGVVVVVVEDEVVVVCVTVLVDPDDAVVEPTDPDDCVVVDPL